MNPVSPLFDLLAVCCIHCRLLTVRFKLPQDKFLVCENLLGSKLCLIVTLCVGLRLELSTQNLQKLECLQVVSQCFSRCRASLHVVEVMPLWGCFQPEEVMKS